MPRGVLAVLLSLAPMSGAPGIALGRQAGAPQAPAPAAAAESNVSPAQVKAAIERLGSFDFAARMEAARTIRRAEPALAVPALLETAGNPSADGYVRYRALVLLSGFNDPRTGQTMLGMIEDRNDRLRAVVFAWFEYHVDPAALVRLFAVVDREESEFVRPALTRALAAHSTKPLTGAAAGLEPKLRETMTRLVMSGQNIFRAAVIEALGEYRAAYALPAIIDVAKLEGPLQDDAILAIGRIGDKRGHAVLADLQRIAPRTLQPTVAAAICLLGSNCGSHEGYLIETLKFAVRNPGHQELLRAAAAGLAALAINGSQSAAAALFDLGAPARDPERAPIALALGNLALRNPGMLLQAFESRTDPQEAIGLLRDAFDMLDEDFEEERFYVSVRRAYWAAPAGSPGRKIAELLIQRLEF